jgi:hypothetical protein
MSYQAVEEVGRYSQAKGALRLVLLTIAHFVAHETGIAEVSNKEIAAFTLIDSRDVIRYIKRLEKSGEIKVERGKWSGKKSVFQLCLQSGNGGNIPTVSENKRMGESPPFYKESGNFTQSKDGNIPIQKDGNIPPPVVRQEVVKSTNSSTVEVLFSKLIELGVWEKDAREFTDNFPERIESQIEWVHYRNPKPGGLPGLLARAIRENWGPPPRWLAEQGSTPAPPTPAPRHAGSTPPPQPRSTAQFSPTPANHSPRRETNAQADAREARERQQRTAAEADSDMAARYQIAATTFARYHALGNDEKEKLRSKIADNSPAIAAKVEQRGGIENVEANTPLWASFLEAVHYAIQDAVSEPGVIVQ